MKKQKNKYVLSSLLCLLPMIIGAIFYRELPEQMPIHWDINGNVDGYASKFFALFGLPMIMFMIDAFSKFFIANDPKGLDHNDKLLSVFKYLLPVLTTIIIAFEIYTVKFEQNLNISNIMFIFVGGLFIVIGYFMPKMKQNYTMGIKLPWTLNSVDNWNKTHKFASFIFIIGGIFIILTSFINNKFTAIIYMVEIFVICFAPCIYSFVEYNKNKK